MYLGLFLCDFSFFGFTAAGPAVYGSIKEALKTLGDWKTVADVFAYTEENCPVLKGIKKHWLRKRLNELALKKEVEKAMPSQVGYYRLPPGRRTYILLSTWL